MHRLLIYTKPGCHLCEEVEILARDVARQGRIVVELRNILDSLEDYERYKHEIPVVMLNGTEIARYHLSHTALEAALREADGRS